jgi:serine/threonine protein kinase
MAAKKPPWSEGNNGIGVLFQIAEATEPPKLPPDLSPEIKDFIFQCFKRTPTDRPNVYQLLRHPFILE